MALKFYWTKLALLLILSSSAQVSPFNNKEVKEVTGSYSFIVSGHFHGDTQNKSSLPASTLLSNLDWVNDSSNLMLISLGDLFLDVTKDPEYYERLFFPKIQIPLFNAVGNHDLTDDIYQNRYGKTFFYFFTGGDCHIILDTEINNGDIKGEQKDMLEKALKESEKEQVKNIFVYGHRTIWSREHPKMNTLFQDNTQSLTGNNFKSEIIPLFNRLEKNINIYFFAGSLGSAPASFFYHKEKDKNIYYICSAIRNLNRDAMLKVNRQKNGEVKFETFSLTGNTVKNLEAYNLKLYLNYKPVEPFNWRLVPLYFYNMATHRYFWFGALWTLGGLAFLYFFFFRRRKRKGKMN